MKTRWMTVMLLLLLLLASNWPASAQGVVNLSIDSLSLDEFPQAKAKVTVRDANGVPITGLEVGSFEIVEDGRASFPPSEVTMQVNPDAVTSVVMVIDISGSMKGKPIEEAIRAANALLDQLSPQDRAAIIAFADEVESLDPTMLEEEKEYGFTTDKNAIRNVVNFLDTKIGWDTPLYDAIYKGVKMAAMEPSGKRAVVVMTDGRDERDNAEGVAVKDAGSLSTPDDPINEANRHNIPIFSVGLVGLGGKIDTKYLQRLAERTGGIYQQAPQPEELTPLFENVIDQLKTQYVLSYASTLTKDDQHHSLMIRVALPQGQDFDETKFQIVPSEPAPPEPTVGEVVSAAPTEAAEITTEQTRSGPTVAPAVLTPEPSSTGMQAMIDSLREAVKGRPLLAVLIGGGALLLVLLLIALLVVLFQRRESTVDEYPAVEFTEAYGPAPSGWTPDATDAGIPTTREHTEDRTEIAPGAWPEGNFAGEPLAANGTVLAGGVADAGGVPPAGGTRLIERAPRHLAMLVDKTRPDRKYDLKGTTNVGRAGENQVVLDDPTVSRHHAWIKVEEESCMVFDIGSANGTFVNDVQIDEPCRLESGDVVRFGDAEFVFTRVF